ncbi:uncharacterized protein LOC120187056 isoform X2 [Hibiscus syriacus]|uniref:uncharacterized protein LOC120187056 isoform X2 n=1 Tax=Hibiscus syriacus TaxID=106335 RepID=UPI0019235931|nr:uncharacterized protein LOC120187056 isoform X2 [Hibiscus syriacus]
MQRRRSRRSPLPMASPAPEETQTPPKSTIFNKRKRNIANASHSNSASAFFNHQSSPPDKKTLTTISDLKEFTSSRLEDMKRNLIDRSHSEILKDLDASHSRFHKRFKIQTQACQQVMEEAEKEYKKISEKIDSSHEAMKASYAEFMADAQATASLCKTSISELSKSFEKGINDLRNRFGMPSA